MDMYEIQNKMKMENKTIHDLNLRVTFYARVSTTREEQESSIESQVKFFTEMIQRNPNWEFVDGYVDKLRGESAENRISFMQMIEDGKAGEFDLILTKEVSRFARNTIDSLTYTRDLYRAGVGVYFQNDNICTMDPDSELRLTIMSSIATDEVRKMSERIKWGHKRAIEKGVVMGNSRIFGYEKNNGKLVINEKEAEMIRLIFDLYSTGNYSSRKIENILYDKGYRGRNGTRIHHNTINGIIQNPKYKGYYCGNKVKITDYRTKEQRYLPEKDWIMYKDESGETVPAIVSEEIWDKAFAIFKEKSTAIKARGRSFKPDSVLSGKIWCKADDKPYWRTSYSNSVSQGKPIYQWICSEKKRNGAKSCSSIAIMEEELYTMLSDYFKKIIPNIEEYISTFLTIYRHTDESKNNLKTIQSLKEKLEREKTKRDTLLDLCVEGLINKQEFKERNDAANITIADIEENIYQLEQKSLESESYAKEIKKIETYFKTMYSPDKEMEREQVDEIIYTIIDRIDVVPKNDTSMKLEVKLKTGLQSDMMYIRTGSRYGRRSGHITKKMVESYKMQ
ncbi:MAG: recombinase family protein [Oscillospiraceae bacterium]|nr:recombinase family protein [Oscillospiraceae bacterium]